MVEPITTEKFQIKKVYLKDFAVMVATLEARCLTFGDEPSAQELRKQIFIRVSTFMPNTARRYMTSVRAVVSGRIINQAWHEDLNAPDWLANMKEEEVMDIHEELKKSYSVIQEEGAEILTMMTSNILQNGHHQTEGELVEDLTGVRNIHQGAAQPNRSALERVTPNQMQLIDKFLEDDDPIDALRSLSQKRTNNRALLRIFARSIWLTGMRPVEVFNCCMMIPRTDKEYSDAERKAILTSPTAACFSGLLMSIEELDLSPWASFPEAVAEIKMVTELPAILLIENAKTTNGAQGIVIPYRTLILDGMADNDLDILSMAARIRNFDISEARRKNLRTSMTRLLKSIAKNELPGRSTDLTLYSFRHDFATRVRSRLDIHEAAALMGHTSRFSTYHYGEKFTRKKSSGSQGWLPKWDASIATTLQEHWSRGPEASASPDTASNDQGTPRE